MKSIRLIAFFLLFCHVLSAQKGNSGNIIAVNLTGAYQLAGGDLADRFGVNVGLGGGVDYITAKNWIFGGEGSWIIGNNIKTDILATLRNSNGFIVANNGFVADMPLKMRGLYLGAHAGKFIPFSSSNKRSGFRVTLGGGFFQHKIKIQDDPEAPVAALTNEYKKGYDRLTSGYAIREFVGYQYFSENRRINFYFGVEATQAVTESKRGYNYDLEAPDTDSRLDLIYGLKAGWILPFYVGGNKEEPSKWY